MMGGPVKSVDARPASFLGGLLPLFCGLALFLLLMLSSSHTYSYHLLLKLLGEPGTTLPFDNSVDVFL